jgi:hypothetical protein
MLPWVLHTAFSSSHFFVSLLFNQSYSEFVTSGTRSFEGSAKANGHIYFLETSVSKIHESNFHLPLQRSYRTAACTTLFSTEHSYLHGTGATLHCLLMLISRIATALPNEAIYVSFTLLEKFK